MTSSESNNQKIEEVFKMLNDFPAYRISNFGRIQSRWVTRACYDGFKVEDVWNDLTPGNDGNGYPQVVLCDGYGKKRTTRVHNLVAKYFLGPKPHKSMIVRHVDSNPSNNHVSNLAYGTYTDNENDKISNGTWNTRNGGAKITPKQVKEIREKLKSGSSQEDLASEYCVSRPTINRISNNKIWREVV